jgi:hypothetical protein
VGAPIAMTEPSADMPRFEPAASAAMVLFAGGSTSLAWVKVPPDSVNTNTAPLRLLMPVCPAATISPLLETATESPPPFSCAVCVQVLAPAALVNTTVAPTLGSPNAIVEPLEEIALLSPRKAGTVGVGAGAGFGFFFAAETVRASALADEADDADDDADGVSSWVCT